MAVRLRLTRVGKKKQPTYRIVAADARSPRDGKYLEIVGTYDPRREPSAITVDNDKAVSWLRKGALPSERVEKLLKDLRGLGRVRGVEGRQVSDDTVDRHRDSPNSTPPAQASAVLEHIARPWSRTPTASGSRSSTDHPCPS